MKSVFVLAIAGLVASVSAQSLSDLPSCALTCLTTGLAATGCSITDFKCACSNTAFVSESATCIQSSCPEADQQKALSAAGALCAAAGVTIPTTFPAASSAPATSTATSAQASSSAAATTSAPAATSTAASSSEAPVSSGTVESFPTVIASSTLRTSAVASASATGNLTSSASVPVQTTNSANRLGGVGGLALAGLGFAGYLAL